MNRFATLDELDSLTVTAQVLSQLIGECPEGLIASKNLAVALGYLAERQQILLATLQKVA
jgi:hypothetical protein